MAQLWHHGTEPFPHPSPVRQGPEPLGSGWLPRRSPVRQQAQRPTTKGGSPGPGLPTPARHYLQVTLRATRKAQPSAMAAPHSSSGRRAMRAARGRGLEAAAGPGPPHNDITPGRGGAGRGRPAGHRAPAAPRCPPGCRRTRRRHVAPPRAGAQAAGRGGEAAPFLLLALRELRLRRGFPLLVLLLWGVPPSLTGAHAPLEAVPPSPHTHSSPMD